MNPVKPPISRAERRDKPDTAENAEQFAQLENPLLEGLAFRRTPEPCVLVIFGASGDLTQRKLFPALYSLALRRLLPEQFAVVGVARTESTDEEFRERMKEAVQEHARDEFHEEVWDSLAEGMRYVATDFADEAGVERLVEQLNGLDEEHGTRGNRVYYLAIPPDAIGTVVVQIGKRRATKGWTRLIVEKPFGHDLASARSLNETIHEYFREEEVFRIDHYLGKETVQNMLALRFANGIFEPIWNRQFIDHVQITVAETMGIEKRAAFYEQAGAIRDIFQNHLLQLVALTAMEPPSDFTADSVRNEKVKVLHSLHTPGPKSVVRGQYGRGFVEGEEVPGYREEEGVAPDSMTETFVAAKLYVDNWRWADTPFYVRAGKRLARRETTIAIQFQRAPHPPFEETVASTLRPNVLLIHVQPDEGVSLAIAAKVPGQGMTLRTVHMDFLYGGAFRTSLPEAYERLILDAMVGDATLFTREDEVAEQWSLVDAIVAAWARDRPAFPNYAAGTWGPPSADELIHRDGRSWRRH
jgi:glucose-6-phosphate 1-dehydrogenase